VDIMVFLAIINLFIHTEGIPMKRFLLLSTFVFMTVACSSVQKYVNQGLEAGQAAAEKEAKKYVDKQGGTGTFDDTMKMQGDKDKSDNLLPYYITVNQMCDAKKIDEKQRDNLKAQFDTYYAQWKDGTLTKEDYDKKCTECIENADSSETAK
jgi:hypothetical protein